MNNRQNHPPTSRFSRRRFLGVIGAGAVVLGAGSVLDIGTKHIGLDHVIANQGVQATPEARFGRLFRLPAFAEPSTQVEAALIEIGRPGGLLDAKDALERGPVDLITDPALSLNNRNNSIHTAGTNFMGQFMDHDMTFDAGSRLGSPTEPRSAINGRTPAFDLDSVYGNGPISHPQLYDPNDSVKFLVESCGQFEDLPRSSNNRAIIADPRNDENLMIAGLNTAFLVFHNHAVDYVRAQGTADPSEVFDEARLLTTWHYQWLILREFLPLFIGQAMVDDILAHGRRFYLPKDGAFIPVEFQGAAYRFGHSMVRPSYRANLAGDVGGPFFGFTFDAAEVRKPDPNDLSSGHRASRRFIGWQTFFDFGDGEVKPNKRIDTKISTPLFNLPLGAIPALGGPTSLAQRNLLRHLTWRLPSGQSIAQHMAAPTLSRQDLEELSVFGLNLDQSTPLWYYILKEAEIVEDGLRLGPVGGRIVGEVIIGLLQTDPMSYLSVSPSWRPTLPTSSGDGDFRMVDFLTFAGVDPASRGQ
jgi:hypothetical protein